MRELPLFNATNALPWCILSKSILSSIFWCIPVYQFHNATIHATENVHTTAPNAICIWFLSHEKRISLSMVFDSGFWFGVFFFLLSSHFSFLCFSLYLNLNLLTLAVAVVSFSLYETDMTMLWIEQNIKHLFTSMCVCVCLFVVWP